MAAPSSSSTFVCSTCGATARDRDAGPPPLPPPEPGRLAGWLRLGEVVYPGRAPHRLVSSWGTDPARCDLRTFRRRKDQHGAVSASGLLARGVPFLIFDWKRNYRDILAAPWVREGEVVALTAGRDLAPLRLNPLRPPPGTDPRTWLKKIIEITPTRTSSARG